MSEKNYLFDNRPKTRCGFGFLIVAAFALAVTCLIPVAATLAQDSKASLAFVPAEADSIMIARPAQIMTSREFKAVHRKNGAEVDRLVDRMNDSFFDWCGVELHEINQVTAANAVPTPKPGASLGSGGLFSVTVIQTLADNMVRFEMVTQMVDEEIEYRGKTFFKLSKPVNRNRYAFIADEKTIVWSGEREGIERAIDTGRKGKLDTEWYSAWSKRHAEKDLSLIVTKDTFRFFPFPEPYSRIKECHYILAGADIGRELKIVMHTALDSEAAAKELADVGKQAVELGKMSLAGAERSNSEEEYEKPIKIAKRALDATKFETTGKKLSASTSISIDFSELIPMMATTSNAALRTQSANNIRQIAIAMHNYHDANGRFPPSVLTHESGKTYSWRIAILPHIEQQAIYDQYDFTQSWNSPHNAKITAEMPAFFHAGSPREKSNFASYFMVVGKGAAGGVPEGLKLTEVNDGASNTILAVESKQRIHWAQPKDIPFDKKQFRNFGGFFDGGFNAVFCDAHVQFVSDKLSIDSLYGLLTINGGEQVSPNDVD